MLELPCACELVCVRSGELVLLLVLLCVLGCAWPVCLRASACTCELVLLRTAAWSVCTTRLLCAGEWPLLSAALLRGAGEEEERYAYRYSPRASHAFTVQIARAPDLKDGDYW